MKHVFSRCARGVEGLGRPCRAAFARARRFNTRPRRACAREIICGGPSRSVGPRTWAFWGGIGTRRLFAADAKGLYGQGMPRGGSLGGGDGAGGRVE